MTKIRFEVFLGRVEKIRRYYKWRYGQALFNSLLTVNPELAEEIRGGSLDPFFKETKADLHPDLLPLLEARWSVREEPQA
jgi:hypothetical protein